MSANGEGGAMRRCPWEKAGDTALALNGAILAAIFALVALGAGNFGENSPRVGIHLRVDVSGAAMPRSPFWRKPCDSTNREKASCG